MTRRPTIRLTAPLLAAVAGAIALAALFFDGENANAGIGPGPEGFDCFKLATGPEVIKDGEQQVSYEIFCAFALPATGPARITDMLPVNYTLVAAECRVLQGDPPTAFIFAASFDPVTRTVTCDFSTEMLNDVALTESSGLGMRLDGVYSPSAIGNRVNSATAAYPLHSNGRITGQTGVVHPSATVFLPGPLREFFEQLDPPFQLPPVANPPPFLP